MLPALAGPVSEERILGTLIVEVIPAAYSKEDVWNLIPKTFPGTRKVFCPGLIKLYVESYMFSIC